MTIEIKDVVGISEYKCEFLLNATGIQNDNSLAQKAGLSLGKYAINLNDRAKSGKLDPVIGREEEYKARMTKFFENAFARDQMAASK